MKQTLTVNLNGIAFHIDQDAYQKLNDYLTQVRAHLNVNDDKDEIIADIEARIGEVFTEKLRQKRQEVVNMEMVQEIIDMLGQPTDYSDEASEEQAEPENKKHKHLLTKFGLNTIKYIMMCNVWKYMQNLSILNSKRHPAPLPIAIW